MKLIECAHWNLFYLLIIGASGGHMWTW